MIIFDHKEGGGGQANDHRIMLMYICGGRGVHDEHLKIKRIGGKLLEYIPLLWPTCHGTSLGCLVS